jgi:hypothetical protein
MFVYMYVHAIKPAYNVIRNTWTLFPYQTGLDAEERAPQHKTISSNPYKPLSRVSLLSFRPASNKDWGKMIPVKAVYMLRGLCAGQEQLAVGACIQYHSRPHACTPSGIF